MARNSIRLGRVQLQVMQVLWEHGPATARDITQTLCLELPIAHSTVQTLLRQLESKGAVAHDVVERTFVYRPLVQQDDVALKAVRDLVARLFDGSVYGLVSHLFLNEQISPEDLQRLRDLVNRNSPNQEEQP